MRHYVLVGYSFPYLIACQSEYHMGGDRYPVGVEAEELSDAPELPKCKRCLRTSEYRLHDR